MQTLFKIANAAYFHAGLVGKLLSA